MEMASHLSRFFSGVINLVIWILVAVGLLFLFSYIFVYVLLSKGMTLQEIQENATLLISQDRLIHFFLYFIVFGFWDIVLAAMTASNMQGSLGKYFLKIKVTDLDGDRLSFVKAFLRETLKSLFVLGPLLFSSIFQNGQTDIGKWKVIFSMCLLITFSCYFLIFITKNRQALHDLMMGTLVTKKG